MAQEFRKFSGFEVCDAYARKEIDIMKNRKFIFIADSYGVGSNPDGLTLDTWTKLVPQYLGLSEENYHVSNVSGAGFNCNLKFLSQLQAIEGNLTDEEKEKITDIVVCGGANDRVFTQNDVEVAIKEFADYVKAHFTNAVFRVGHIGWSKNQNNSGICYGISLPAYRNVVKYGGVYLNNVEYSNHEYDGFVSDGWHPNQKGQNTIATSIANAILTGACNVTYFPKSLDTAECMFEGGTNFDSTKLPPIRTTLTNGSAMLYTTAFLNVSFTARTLAGHGAYNLLKLGNARLVSGSASFGSSMENLTITINSSTGTKYHLPGAVYLSIDSDGNSYLGFRIYGDIKNYDNITSVNIPSFKMILNSEFC